MIYISFTQEQLDKVVESAKTLTEFVEALKTQEPVEGDGFTQADLDKVIEALSALVPAPEA